MKTKLFMAWVCLCLATAVFGQEIRIAEFTDIDLVFDGHSTQNRQTISAPGASFIKVHFEYFNLPNGVFVEVRNPAGTEVYQYGMNDRDDYTFDEFLGENGIDRFASLSITGDTAIVNLIFAADVALGPDHGVVVSRYMEGFPNGIIEDMTGERLYEEDQFSTCGANSRTPVECYKTSYPTEYTRARAVARLVMSGSLCTAWRVSDDNRMFTNNHCMSTSSAVTGSESWFNYQYSSCSGTTLTTPIKVSGASMLATNSSLDYTLYTVNNFSTISDFGNLGLDVRAPVLNEEIYIPQHGSGNPKELAITDDQNSTGLCRIDNPNDGNDAAYYCDTIGGSSGSPVLARSSHKVIALHHYGGCTNSGVRMNLIWPQVSSHFGGVIPNGNDGSGGGGGNCTPYSNTTSNLSASRSNWIHTSVVVPECATTLVASISGSSGDADLYVRYGAAPTTSSYNCRPYTGGSNETCTLNDPTAGTWHVGIRAYSTFSGVTRTITYN